MRHILLGLLLIGTTALAQDWPAKPVRVIVGYPAGGGHDFTARIIAQRLSEVLKQPFVVENRSGASAPSPPTASPRVPPTAIRSSSPRPPKPWSARSPA